MLENENDIKENLLESQKDSIILGINEKKKISPLDFDKLSLIKIGYDKNLVDIIFKNAFPANIDECLDYLYKNSDNLFTHSYISTKSGKCAICEQKKYDHSTEKMSLKDRENRHNQALKIDSLHLNYGKYNDFDFSCGICEDEITFDDYKKIKMPCHHNFCVDCWFEYLKEKINNSKVYKISCMEHKCNQILDEEFIRKIIDKDKDLLKKYEKFLSTKKLMDSNKNIKFCPIPDCDGYAEKHWSKYVKCNFGHEFCFVCGEKPHGWKSCSKIIDQGFEDWKSHTLVKRCPYCKFWTEKNEGCNHMTCSQCNFQWCWVCEQECVAGHYLFGTCKGLHFSDVRKKGDAKNLLCHNCGLYCCFTYIIMKIVFLIIYLTMMPYFYLAVKILDYFDDKSFEDLYFIWFFYASFLPFFICYEVLTICYVAVFSIPGIIICPYYRFLRYLFYGKIFGRLFSV